MNRLYILDDEEDILFSLGIWFRKSGYDVKTFYTPKDMYYVLERELPDAILLDVNLQGEDGRDVCMKIKNDYSSQCPVVLFSANPYIQHDYKYSQADDFVSKPFSLTHLSSVIASHIEV